MRHSYESATHGAQLRPDISLFCGISITSFGLTKNLPNAQQQRWILSIVVFCASWQRSSKPISETRKLPLGFTSCGLSPTCLASYGLLCEICSNLIGNPLHNPPTPMNWITTNATRSFEISAGGLRGSVISK